MYKKFLLLTAATIFIFTVHASAQTTARLSGIVTDASGAVLPGAQVTVANTNTGISRTMTTDDKGRFVAAQLAPGPYQITATMAGFEKLLRTGITLEIGQEAELSLAMKVGAVSEQVTVTGEAPLVNTSGSAVAGTVEEKRILELPLNGRDFTQLALVQPGMYLARKSDTVGTKGFGTRISVAGSRVDQTAWLLDGTNIRGASAFGVPGSAAGLVLGVDAVREFQVLTSNYSAEFGFTSGGVVNMVTKSGANDFHGTAYEFLRNSVLDARNFFDPRKPPFKRNQFGASLGGPIRRERAFFFGNYEGLRQRLGVTRIAQVPDANVRRGLVPDRTGVLQPVQISASTRPYLELYPLPNGSPVLAGGVPTGISLLNQSASQPTNENYFVTRVDYRINDKQSVFTRFTFDEGDSRNPDRLPITSTDVLTRTRYSTVQHQYIVTPQFLMTSRVAYNRSVLASTTVLNVPFPASVFIFNPSLPPTISYPGASDIAPNLQSNFSNTTNLYQFAEDMVYTRGNHSMKIGGDFEKYGLNFDGGSRDFGAFTWGSMTDFLQDNRVVTFTIGAPGSSARRTMRQRFLGLYFQDDWKVRSRLSVNLGLRYEPFSIPTEKWGRLATIRDWRTATEMQNNIPFFNNPSKKYLSPRVGFAWDPQGNGKTSVRGGLGIFYLPATLGWWRTQTYRNPPFFALLNAVSPGTPNLAGAVPFVNQVGPTILTTKTSSSTFVQLPNWDIRSSYEMKVNLTVERDLGWDTRLAAGYLGGRGIGLWRLASANAAPPTLVNGRPFVAAGTRRPNPNLSTGAMNFSDAQSFYNALQVELKKRFSHGLQFQTSYTWSKNMDDSTTGGVATDYNEGDSSQPYNPKGDRGLSALHVAQNFVVNGLYSIPSPQKSGVASYILGGWQLSGIFTAASGIPFVVNVSGFNAPDLARSSGRQRPDLVAGRSAESIVLGRPTKYFDTSAFVLPTQGFYGNLGRNVVLGPGLVNVDTSLLKNFRLPLGEASRLEFHADLFNILNRANFDEPASVVLNATNRSPVAGAGLITRTTTNARQIQFGLKLIF